MKIVIDIPEELYKANNRGLQPEELWDLRVAIKNGTPLPQKSEAEVTETSMHHLICSFCDNDKCVRGTKECEFEKWKKKQESEEEG